MPSTRWERERKEGLRDENGDLIQLEFPFAMTHVEIAKELGITPQRVGQIERRALRKLRNAFLRFGVSHSSDLIPRCLSLARRRGLARIQMQ